MVTDQRRTILDRIRADELTRLCQDLVRIDTVNPPGHELAAAQYVAGYLAEAGFETRLVPLDGERASVVGRLPGRGGRPSVVFNGHIDVVPAGAQGWSHEPFSGQVADGRVWGRGTTDMKGGVASMLAAARALALSEIELQGDLLVAATADEEAGMLGAESLTAPAVLGPLQAIFIAEPTYNEIGVAERGVLWLELTTYGKTAHGSMPELGRNAVTMMMALLTELDRLVMPYVIHPTLGKFTRSINTISGGVKTNVVPDQCVATVDMRTVPGQDHKAILRQVEDLMARFAHQVPDFRASQRVLYDRPFVDTPANQPAVQAFADAVAAVTGRRPEPGTVRFATEAAVFVPALGVPAIICGPGDPALCHQPDEFVEIDKMVETARIFALAAAGMLA